MSVTFKKKSSHLPSTGQIGHVNTTSHQFSKLARIFHLANFFFSCTTHIVDELSRFHFLCHFGRCNGVNIKIKPGLSFYLLPNQIIWLKHFAEIVRFRCRTHQTKDPLGKCHSYKPHLCHWKLYGQKFQHIFFSRL